MSQLPKYQAIKQDDLVGKTGLLLEKNQGILEVVKVESVKSNKLAVKDLSGNIRIASASDFVPLSIFRPVAEKRPDGKDGYGLPQIGDMPEGFSKQDIKRMINFVGTRIGSWAKSANYCEASPNPSVAWGRIIDAGNVDEAIRKTPNRTEKAIRARSRAILDYLDDVLDIGAASINIVGDNGETVSTITLFDTWKALCTIRVRWVTMMDANGKPQGLFPESKPVEITANKIAESIKLINETELEGIRRGGFTMEPEPGKGAEPDNSDSTYFIEIHEI